MGGSRFSTLCLAVLALACNLAVAARDVALGGGLEAPQWRAGMRALTQVGIQEQIVEWVDAPCGRFPYMASLRTMSGDHKCGGVLVDKQWVLTAAHCVENTSALYPSHVVLLGLCNGGEDKGTDDFGRVVEVFMGEKIVLHPNYTGTTRGGYDIALVMLNRESKNVPVNLATNPNELVNKRKVAAIGFGTSDGGIPADTLKFTNELSIVPNSVCEQSWEGVIQDSMVCAIVLDGVADMCPGDSGGPLLLPYQPGGKVENGDPEVDKIVGVTSFGGRKACGEAGGPAVYTRVTSFADWIASVLEATKDNNICTCVCAPGETQEPEVPDEVVVPQAPGQPAALAPAPVSAPAGTAETVQLVESADPNTGSLDLPLDCTCSQDGVSAGVETGFGGCTRRLEAGAALCYVLPNLGDCLIARNSSLFPGALWIACADRTNADNLVVQKIRKDEAQDTAQINKALREAGARGQEAIVRDALLAGANPETLFRGVPVLHAAASMDFVAVGTALIEAGVNVDSKDNMDGSTSLHKAAGWGNLDFVALLVEAGANSTIKNNDGKMARNSACEFNLGNPICPRTEIMALLEAP